MCASVLGWLGLGCGSVDEVTCVSFVCRCLPFAGGSGSWGGHERQELRFDVIMKHLL